MPDQTPEALAKWCDDQALLCEQKADSFTPAEAGVFMRRSNTYRATAALLREQAAELAELRAVVERLPKTVDGVTVAKSMTVWTVHGDVTYGMRVKMWGDECCCTYQSGHLVRNLRPSECYSTEAAALAAKEASRG